MEMLDFIRNGGETRRFHTWPVLRQQTVAEHSFHVAMLVWTLAGSDMPGVRLPLLMAALTHDLAEWRVGDVPSPAKRAMSGVFPDFRAKWGEMEESILRLAQLDWQHDLTAEELRILKLADTCEGALYCIRERAMGNKLIATCYRNFRTYIDEVRIPEDEYVPLEPTPMTAEQQVIQYIDDMWEQANAQ